MKITPSPNSKIAAAEERGHPGKHAVTLLREFRGDAHVAALVSTGLDGLDAIVIATTAAGGTVQLSDPFITAAVEGDVRPGQRVKATLVTADIATGATRFRVAGVGVVD